MGEEITITGGEVDYHHVSASIRHSVFVGSARLLYEGREEVRHGDIYLPEAPASVRDQMREAISEAKRCIAKVKPPPWLPWLSWLADKVNLVAVHPLSAPLAKGAHEFFSVLEVGLDKHWEEIVKGHLLEGTDQEWDKLRVVHRTYVREWRATYEGGSDKVRQLARRSLHKILGAFLAELGDSGSKFALKALPVMASICITLLDGFETQRMNDHLRNLALGAESPPIDFGAFKFVAEGGYGGKEVDILNKQIYPDMLNKWREIKDGAPNPLLVCDGGSPPMYLFEDRTDTGVIAWQVAKGSTKRQTIFVAAGLGQALAENPLALAEVLIYELVAHIPDERPFTNHKNENRLGEEWRQKVLETCTPSNPRLQTLADLLPEVMTPARTPGRMALPSPPQGPSQRAPSPLGTNSNVGEARLRLVCPQCGKAGRVRGEYAGRRVKCSKCGGIMLVPGEPR
jgi:hypothetical protein